MKDVNDITLDLDQVTLERDWLAERLSCFCALSMLGLPLAEYISREWVSAAIAGRSSEFWLDAAHKAVSPEKW